MAENQEKDKFGYARGLSVEKVLGANRKENGQLWLLVKWQQDTDDTDNTTKKDKIDLIEADKVNAKDPQSVIQFYEERLFFTDDGKAKQSTSEDKDEAAASKNKRPRMTSTSEDDDDDNEVSSDDMIEVIGATNSHNNLKYLVKSENGKHLLTAEDCHQKCPQALIKFFEEKGIWNR